MLVPLISLAILRKLCLTRLESGPKIMYFNVACLEDYAVLLRYVVYWGTRWRSWLRHCSTSRKVADSILDGVIGSFH